MIALARLALCLCLVLAFPAGAATPAPEVKIDTGRLRGEVRDGVERFMSVPYAAAPVGALRWRPPRPAAPWTGVRDARPFGPRCPQAATGETPRSETEDCLVLNVFRPERDAQTRRPVLVYVHGGGATNGAGADHDGSALAREGGLVVVTLNYRLGAMGFMAHPALAAEDPSGAAGNYGVMDVEAALRWVARNIKRFGGDPAKVTLAGESAGGTVVCPLLVSKTAAGLFRAAILSSDDCLHDIDDAETAATRAEALARRLGCDEMQGLLACLRAASPAELIGAGGFAAPHFGGPGQVQASAFRQIAKGAWRSMPVMLGSNRDEGRIAGLSFRDFDQARYRAWLERLTSPEDAEAILQLYPLSQYSGPLAGAYAASHILTDSGMRGYGGCTSLQLAQSMSRSAPIFFYQFEDPDPPMGAGPEGWRFGAAHGSELAYLWPAGPFAKAAARFTPPQQRLSREMIQRWAAFVRAEDPNAPGLIHWPRLSRRARFYMALRPGDASRVEPITLFADTHNCAFWGKRPWIMDRGDPG